MVTIVTVDNDRQTLWARTLDVDAASGDLVLAGKPTTKQIRDAANEQLAAPDPIPNYNGYSVEWAD